MACANDHPWDAAAAGWNRHAALIHAWLRDATRTMLADARIGPGARVLDIAAGAGDQTLDIARLVGVQGWVLATDVAPGILALARDNAHAAGFSQVGTRVADAQSLGLAGAGFDAAVCRLGLMFCRSPLAALEGIRAALKPQGRFTALVFGQPEHNPCLTITLQAVRQHAGMAGGAVGMAVQGALACKAGSLMSLGGPGVLEDLLHAAGFGGVATRTVSAPFHAASATHYVDFLRTSASPIIDMLAPLSSAAQQAAWHDLTQRLEVFGTRAGWIGPNSLLLCVAVAP
jgi:ubiquinone/menaquinone biosynthesis C-methylase UbiE